MAKQGITMGLTVMQRDGKLFPRKAHNAQNAHNVKRQSCIAKAMTGRKFKDRKAQQAAFREAAKRCK